MIVLSLYNCKIRIHCDNAYDSKEIRKINRFVTLGFLSHLLDNISLKFKIHFI